MVTALCALVAVSSPALASLAANRLATAPAPAQYQVVLWWLQSSHGATTSGALTGREAAALLDPAAWQELGPRDVARLLAALDNAAAPDASLKLPARHLPGHFVPPTTGLTFARPIGSIAPRQAFIARQALAPHAASRLGGTRTNRNLE